MNVHRIRCDNCQREVDDLPGIRWAPDGWYLIEGVYGGHEPYDLYHACSLDCMIEWANRQRRNALLLPVVLA